MADHDQALLHSLLTVAIGLIIITSVIDEAETIRGTITHNITWNENVSTLYPPSSPLKVRLGDKLSVSCPPDGTSNLWIQTDLLQYEMCDCNATGVDNPDCRVSTTTRQVCQDEVIMTITTASNELTSALSFEPGIYYFISYSPGNAQLDGYSSNSEGGECLDGYKMAMIVLSLSEPDIPPTTIPPTITTVSTDVDPEPSTTDREDIFITATGRGPGNRSLETSTPLLSTTQNLSTIVGWAGFAASAMVVLLVVLMVSIISLYRYQRKRIRSWALSGIHNPHVENEIPTVANDLCDTKCEPEMVGNYAYETSTFKPSVKENVAYGAIDSQVLTSDNAAYGTSANDVPTSDNASTTKTNDDGPVYDSVDYI